jgi:glycosyltransferase involved in cell wall biosynthesis
MNTYNTHHILQLCLPHYRVPLFIELTRQLSGSLSIISGANYSVTGPSSVLNIPGVHQINVNNLFIMDKFAIQYPLPRSLFTNDVTVLEFNPRILSNLWILIHRKQRMRPVILWGHGLSPRPKRQQLVKKLRQWMAKCADAIIFYSQKGANDFIQLGLPAEKLFVAHNSVDVEKILQLAAKYSTKRKHILFVGRLIAAKKVDLLIEAFYKASGHLPDETKLIIIGDGPERMKLFSQTKELGILEKVEFAGQITDDELLALYFARSLLLVSPGCIGLVAIHSYAYGVPVLVADTEPHGPEVEVLVPGRNCESFCAGNSDALSKKLIELLAQPSTLLAMGWAAREDVKGQYSLQHMSGVFLRAFDYVREMNRFS